MIDQDFLVCLVNIFTNYIECLSKVRLVAENVCISADFCLIKRLISVAFLV